MKRSEEVLETFKQPKLFARIVAFVVDAAIFFFLTFISISISSFLISREGTFFYQNNKLQNTHIEASKLSITDDDRGYLLYTSKELLEIENDNVVFVNRLSYYYLSYLTGENVDKDIFSLSYNEMLDNGLFPRDYYTIKWFNEEILKIKSVDSFFTYQITDDTKDENKLGILKEEYFENVESPSGPTKRVKYNESLSKFVEDNYMTAVNHFFSQSFIKKAANVISLTNSIILFSSGFISLVIFYVVIPFSSKFGLTIGKRIMGLVLVNDDGFLLKRYKNILRAIPLLAVLIVISFINNLYLQIISSVVIFLVSLTLMVFTPHKQALHDLIARTVLVSKEDAIICTNYDDFVKVFNYKKEDNGDGRK